MSANSRIYIVGGKNIEGNISETSTYVNYRPSEQTNLESLKIASNDNIDGNECYTFTFKQREDTDLISLLEQKDQFDLIEDAEVTYRNQEDIDLCNAGVRKDYVFLT